MQQLKNLQLQLQKVLPLGTKDSFEIKNIHMPLAHLP